MITTNIQQTLPRYKCLDTIISTVEAITVKISTFAKFDKVSEVERERRLALHVTDKVTISSRQYQWTKGIAYSVIGFGFCMTFIHLFYFVKPYQIATGVSDGPLVWNTMEAMLAVGWALLFSLGGWLMLYTVKQKSVIHNQEAVI